MNLPKDLWHTLKGLRKNTLNVLHCDSQVRHQAAAPAVNSMGKTYPLMELGGGWRRWSATDIEIEI